MALPPFLPGSSRASLIWGCCPGATSLRLQPCARCFRLCPGVSLHNRAQDCMFRRSSAPLLILLYLIKMAWHWPSAPLHSAAGSCSRRASSISFLLCWRNDLDAALYNRPTLAGFNPFFPSSLVLWQKQRFGHPWRVSAELVSGLSWACVGQHETLPSTAPGDQGNAPQWGGSLGRPAAGEKISGALVHKTRVKGGGSDLWFPPSTSFLSWFPSQAVILIHSFHSFSHIGMERGYSELSIC